MTKKHLKARDDHAVTIAVIRGVVSGLVRAAFDWLLAHFDV